MLKTFVVACGRIVCQTQWRGQIAQGPIEVRLGSATVRYTEDFQYRVCIFINVAKNTTNSFIMSCFHFDYHDLAMLFGFEAYI